MDGTLNVFRSIQDMDELYEEGFFSRAVPHMEVVEEVKRVIGKMDVYILSACPVGSQFAKAEKDWWLDTYLPEVEKSKRLYLDVGKNKAKEVERIFGERLRKDDVLLDDYSVNLHEWQEAGGTGVKLMNGINGNKGTWKGKSVLLKEINFSEKQGRKEKE